METVTQAITCTGTDNKNQQQRKQTNKQTKKPKLQQ